MLRDEVTKEPLYRQVAHSIEQQVGRGVLRVGDKVPSVRAFSKHNKVSMSTALQAYFWLERHGIPASDDVVDRIYHRAKSSDHTLTEEEVLNCVQAVRATS